MFTQCQNNFTDISNVSKEVQQGLQNCKNDIDTSLKQLQLEFEHNQPILAKWVSGSNTKLRTEQISQTRINLCDTAQKLIDKISTVSGDIDNALREFSASAQQFNTNFNNIGNQINPSPGTPSSMPAQGNTTMDQVIQQAMDALNTAMLGIEQRRVYDQLNTSLDNLIS